MENEGQRQFAAEMAETIERQPEAKALHDIALERLGQQTEFPATEDDDLEPAEWIARIAKHLGRAVSRDPSEFRRELVIVGALALAGVESYDRKQTS